MTDVASPGADTDTHPVPDPARDPGALEQESAERDALAGLLHVLDLASQPGDSDTFVGESQPQPWGRVFGGQVLAQSLTAAQRTVVPERPVHSMHGYFLRAGDSSEPITFAVERLRDGRSFSARRVHAIQYGQPILSMIASFQVDAPGVDHQDEMPSVPDPEDLPTTADLLGSIDHPVARFWARERPVDLRHVERPVYWQGAGERGGPPAGGGGGRGCPAGRCGCGPPGPCRTSRCCTARCSATPATTPCWSRCCAGTG